MLSAAQWFSRGPEAAWTAGRGRARAPSGLQSRGGQAFTRGIRNAASGFVLGILLWYSPLKFQTGQEVSGGGGSDWQLEAPMGREPPLFTSLVLLAPGGAAPTCGSPAQEGVVARAEGEGGGRWRR